MSMNILVAEDSDSFALLYKKSLEARGHKVTVTKNGLECFYKYSDDFKHNEGKTGKSPYDLVILDHQMPRMKGLEVAKQILDLNPSQRILVVTEYVKAIMKGVRELGSKIELLGKPFPSLAMVRQVEGLATYRWRQKMSTGLKDWDGETGLSDFY
ncbi:MAG: response regulator [Crenarchaeota archaeon]|nr:MAG: response regulator [Thermoproteota archaeon]RDJ34231.1 MAG: response regulator [Thermoproteota archaeon]RDJ36655.1 MAG: response regulator [Thermoproteota archaeon]RDJ37814.1 MAG: response regulator [Thermoproteota archaeon]